MGSYFRSCTMKLAILTFLIFSCSVCGGKTVSEAPETIKKEAETKTEDDNKEAETKTEDDNKEDETKTEDDNVVGEDTDKDQEMVDEQLSYWETFVATAPGNNKEEGSGDDLNKEEKDLVIRKQIQKEDEDKEKDYKKGN